MTTQEEEGLVDWKNSLSRRGFVGGAATALGYLTFKPNLGLLAQETPAEAARRSARMLDDYDSLAKISFNENPYGPPQSVLDAITHAFKYANRYGYPDGDIQGEIAKFHGVKPENILLSAGSGECLDIIGSVFCQGGKKVVGVEPSYSQVYQHATSVKGSAYTIPLRPDYSQDIPALIRVTRRNYRNVGFVYLCNPNNPTGRVVPKEDVKQLLDGIPEDTVVLIDEAYHHFVDTPTYESSIKYVQEGRPVIVTRTFSKIAALAGVRLGYAVANKDIIQQMAVYETGGISALAKWAGVAALKDTDNQAKVKAITIQLRQKTMAELNSIGYETIPSETNFFMVHLKKPVVPVIAEFQKKGVLVGRPFPPMTEHLRVSVGTADEMARFFTAFKEIMPNPVKATGSGH